jgi:hypothetical protein
MWGQHRAEQMLGRIRRAAARRRAWTRGSRAGRAATRVCPARRRMPECLARRAGSRRTRVGVEGPRRRVCRLTRPGRRCSRADRADTRVRGLGRTLARRRMTGGRRCRSSDRTRRRAVTSVGRSSDKTRADLHSLGQAHPARRARPAKPVPVVRAVGRATPGGAPLRARGHCTGGAGSAQPDRAMGLSGRASTGLGVHHVGDWPAAGGGDGVRWGRAARGGSMRNRNSACGFRMYVPWRPAARDAGENHGGHGRAWRLGDNRES